jgi:hypothetical protein
MRNKITCFNFFTLSHDIRHDLLKKDSLINSVALVRERTIPTERPPHVGEVSANVCGQRGFARSMRQIPYGRNLGFLDR